MCYLSQNYHNLAITGGVIFPNLSARALDLPFPYAIQRNIVFIVLSAWLATFAGLVYHLLNSLSVSLRGPQRSPNENQPGKADRTEPPAR